MTTEPEHGISGYTEQYALGIYELPRVMAAFNEVATSTQQAAEAMLREMEPFLVHWRVQRLLPRMRLREVLVHGFIPYELERSINPCP